MESCQTVFVTGGYGGLGKSISKTLASQGFNVVIFGRRQKPLDQAKLEIETTKLHADQEVRTVAVDLADYTKVDAAFREQFQIPSALYCAAGGNHAENGFFLDINAGDLDNCMRNNYYASAYPAKSILGIWTENDKNNAVSRGRSPERRSIVFVSSAAAFVSLPGSIAYTPAKVAVRALADTLRMEALRYSCQKSTYTVHCAFPGDFISPGFYLEQNTKTTLTKRMQGTAHTVAELESRFPTSDEVAELIITAVRQGDFIICKDSRAASLLFANMIGPSPKRGFGIVDTLYSVICFFAMPILRRRWEAMCRKDGEENRLDQQVWDSVG